MRVSNEPILRKIYRVENMKYDSITDIALVSQINDQYYINIFINFSSLHVCVCVCVQYSRRIKWLKRTQSNRAIAQVPQAAFQACV